MADQGYTYLFCDWKTRDIIAELPVFGATFDLKLNEPGNFQGFVPLFEADGERDKIPNSLIKDATQPGKRMVYVRRGPRQIVWAGWIWNRVYASNANSLQLNGQTMESYPFRQILQFDLDRNDYPVSEYIALIWRQIENNWLRVGVEIEPFGDYPQNEKRNFRYRFNQGQSMGEMIEDILDTVDSPDYRIDFGYDEDDKLEYRLRVGWPRLERLATETGLAIEFPGNIKNYWYRENVAQAANVLMVQTGGYGSNAELIPVYPSNRIDWTPEYPELMMKMSMRKTNVREINKWGKQQLKKRQPPISVFTAEVESGKAPFLGDYKLGDEVWFYVKDPRFPDGRRFKKRILGWSVTPRRSDSAEDVKLTFNGGEDDFL